MSLTTMTGLLLEISLVSSRSTRRQQYFSQDGASVAAVIPAMDKIDNHLNPTMKKPYHPAIQAVIKLGHKKLNWYYSMTDLSLVY